MIPARYSASRFPGKLMQDLEGKTVILRTYEATVATHLFDEVYVVTDSDIIYNEIVSNGGKAIMSIKEHESGSDRIAEAVQNVECDIVVNVQGDEPFTERSSLEKVLDVFHDDIKHEIDLASLMVQIKDWDEINNPNTVKVALSNTNKALYFSRSEIPNNFDVLLGGFPCQGFSIANIKRSMKDERNFLYKEMLRVIKDKRPKYFVAEDSLA